MTSIIEKVIEKVVEKVVGDLGDKKRWRAYKARVKTLPDSHRRAVDALERYLMYFGAVADGGSLVTMCDDLADLFEQAAADGTPVRAVVGDDPVEFAEDFLRNYADGQWINKERRRLVESIERAEASS